MVKWGTTQNQFNGWFMDVPNLVTGVWVGNEDRSARFQSITCRAGCCCTTCLGLLYKLVSVDEKFKSVERRSLKDPANLR
jgi:penicillin-binding protein 1A